MGWLFYALAARFGSAGVNLTDQYVSRAFGENRVLALITFQNLLIIVPLIVISALHGLK